MRICTIDTGLFKLDGGAMFGVVPKTIWQKLHPPDELNRCTWSMRCLLIDTGDRRILVDTGIGDKQDAKFFGHYELRQIRPLSQALGELGYAVEDITDVLLTHLHFDHVGGAVLRKADGSLHPAFPRAQYWSNASHWNWALKPNAREKASFLRENILPLEEHGQLRFVQEQEGYPFAESISLRFVHGHTRAMMLPQIQYKGRTLVYMADLLPSVHHIPLPYVMAYDMFPLQTLQEKELFLEEALERGYVLVFEHDPDTECCLLQRTDKGIRAGERLRLKDL